MTTGGETADGASEEQPIAESTQATVIAESRRSRRSCTPAARLMAATVL